MIADHLTGDIALFLLLLPGCVSPVSFVSFCTLHASFETETTWWRAYEEKKHIMTLLRVEPHLETRLVQAPHGGKAASFLGFGGSRAMVVARRAKRAADTMVMVQPTMEGFSGATPPLCF